MSFQVFQLQSMSIPVIVVVTSGDKLRISSGYLSLICVGLALQKRRNNNNNNNNNNDKKKKKKKQNNDNSINNNNNNNN